MEDPLTFLTAFLRQFISFIKVDKTGYLHKLPFQYIKLPQASNMPFQNGTKYGRNFEMILCHI